jgi:hypothetical protein
MLPSYHVSHVLAQILEERWRGEGGVEELGPAASRATSKLRVRGDGGRRPKRGRSGGHRERQREMRACRFPEKREEENIPQRR